MERRVWLRKSAQESGAPRRDAVCLRARATHQVSSVEGLRKRVRPRRRGPFLSCRPKLTHSGWKHCRTLAVTPLLRILASSCKRKSTSCVRAVGEWQGAVRRECSPRGAKGEDEAASTGRLQTSRRVGPTRRRWWRAAFVFFDSSQVVCTASLQHRTRVRGQLRLQPLKEAAIQLVSGSHEAARTRFTRSPLYCACHVS